MMDKCAGSAEFNLFCSLARKDKKNCPQKVPIKEPFIPFTCMHMIPYGTMVAYTGLLILSTDYV